MDICLGRNNKMVKVRAFWGDVKTPTIWTFKTKVKAIEFAKNIKKTG